MPAANSQLKTLKSLTLLLNNKLRNNSRCVEAIAYSLGTLLEAAPPSRSQMRHPRTLLIKSETAMSGTQWVRRLVSGSERADRTKPGIPILCKDFDQCRTKMAPGKSSRDFSSLEARLVHKS